MQVLSEVLITFIISSVIGLILALAKIAYKSKCSNIDICCVKITRNIPAELELDEREPPSPRLENAISQRA
jgi:ABC-type amino acid transport system permease subunit